MNIVADTNTFLAVALEEPEKRKIISLTIGHELIAPESLPFEIGNALSAMVKRKKLRSDEAILAWEAVQAIPVDLRNIEFHKALAIAFQYMLRNSFNFFIGNVIF